MGWCDQEAPYRLAHFAEGQVLFREGDPSSVSPYSGNSMAILSLLGTVGAGQFIGEMGGGASLKAVAVAAHTNDCATHEWGQGDLITELAALTEFSAKASVALSLQRRND